MPLENDIPTQKNDRTIKHLKGKAIRFGYEKPAIAGPGRPRLPDTLKERRALLRKKIEEISPDAIAVVNDIINDPRAENKDKLRAAEIALSHALPRQEEVDLNESTNPFARIEPAQLPELLRHIEVEVIDSPKDDSGSDRASA